MKKIDYDKVAEGEQDQDLGWGWNPALARKRSQNYKGDSSAQFFSMGMRMAPQQKKQCINPETAERLRDAVRFWLIVAVSVVALEALMSVTAVQIGALRMCVIWVTILGSLIALGFLVWYKTDDWSFPLGSCVVLTCFLALVGGIVGGDFLAQVHAGGGGAVAEASVGDRLDRLRARRPPPGPAGVLVPGHGGDRRGPQRAASQAPRHLQVAPGHPPLHIRRLHSSPPLPHLDGAVRRRAGGRAGGALRRRAR